MRAEPQQLLFLGSSFLRWLFLGSSLLLGSSFLLGSSLLLRSSLLRLYFLDFLGRLLSFRLLGFLCLLRFLGQLDRPINTSSRLGAAGDEGFSRQHLFDSPPQVALYLLSVVSHLVVGHDILEDCFPGGSSLLCEACDRCGDHGGEGGVGSLHGGLLRLGSLLSGSCCVGHCEIFFGGGGFSVSCAGGGL